MSSLTRVGPIASPSEMVSNTLKLLNFNTHLEHKSTKNLVLNNFSRSEKLVQDYKQVVLSMFFLGFLD